MHIRAYTAHDYEGIAELVTLAEPDRPITAQLLAHYDAQRGPDLLFARWIAEIGGKVVGVANYMQFEQLFVPGEVNVHVRVHPAHQRRGIGSALYEALVDVLRRGPMVTEGGRSRRVPVDTLKAQLRANQLPGMNFAMRRGFIEYARRVESRASLASFDPAAFPDPDAQMAEQGLEMKSVAELASDPDRNRKLYDLKWEVEQDIPIPGEITQQSFEAFIASLIDAPGFVADGSFVVLDGGRYVGLIFHESASASLLMVELTGTARDYRRRGIAQALKLKSMAWAKAAGYESLMVANDLANTGMLAINDKLGFVRQPAIVLLQRKAPF